MIMNIMKRIIFVYACSAHAQYGAWMNMIVVGGERDGARHIISYAYYGGL